MWKYYIFFPNYTKRINNMQKIKNGEKIIYKKAFLQIYGSPNIFNYAIMHSNE